MVHWTTPDGDFVMKWFMLFCGNQGAGSLLHRPNGPFFSVQDNLLSLTQSNNLQKPEVIGITSQHGRL
jgi:hypothetical protein